MNTKKKTLMAAAHAAIKTNPNITTPEFADLIGKNYAHAGSLLSMARKELGTPARPGPSKVEQAMALHQLKGKVSGKKAATLLHVGRHRAYELLHIARKRLGDGKRPTEEAIAWAREKLHLKAPVNQAQKAPPPGTSDPKLSVQSGPLEVDTNAAGKGTLHSPLDNRILTPEELLDMAQIDRDVWMVTRKVLNTWQVGAKHPQTGEILVKPLYQTKLFLERSSSIEAGKAIIQEILEEASKGAPEYPAIEYSEITDPHLLEIAISDLHLGKYAEAQETGESYDCETAERLFLEALTQLVAQAQTYPIGRILFPIGNDFLHIDNEANTTARGTPQDVDQHYRLSLRRGWKLLAKAIDSLQPIAAVDVIIVPGNHDTHAAFAVGEILGTLYANCPQVTIHNLLQPRHYVSFGKTLIGFAHGHAEKQRSLPMLMAVEARSAWQKATFREFHLGHFHHSKSVTYLGSAEEDGVILRLLPSLSASDRWHAQKGYRSQRAAQAFVYHPEAGLVAELRHNLITTPNTQIITLNIT